MDLSNSIIKKCGKDEGKVVAIFGGVHGNEKVGVKTLNKLVNEVDVKRGCVYFVYANPEAIEKNVREVNKNLNRCFLSDNNGNLPEDKRARELMSILDECSSLLDIHAFNDKDGDPFIICEKDSFDIASIMDFPIVSFGWDYIEKGGTDGYMFNSGKSALGLECGSVYRVEDYLDLAEKSAYQFLQYFGCIDKKVDYDKKPQKFIEVVRVAHKKTDDFSFVKQFNNFEELPEGKVFARDGSKEYIAEKGDYILFPRPDKPKGGEAFIIGKLRNKS